IDHRCGREATPPGKLCNDGRCCSQWGWCGTTQAYCSGKCQSQCDCNRDL
uniref:Chitin-binding lectin n=1 Tax=Viscum album TaxID=3972 RepID=CBLE_VISAL|nr:RecName: Full=Chitin-binding lectin [Viscum album]